MNLELTFRDKFAMDVYRLLKAQVERMADHHSDEAETRVTADYWENFRPDYWDRNWRLYDGFLYKVEVQVYLKRYVEMGIDYVRDLYPNPGVIPIEISPLGPEQALTTVRVLIDWHPSEDIPEIRPYFMRLMEPWEKTWGGVMLELVNQAPVLALYNRCEPKWDPQTENWHFWFGYYEAVKGTQDKITLEHIWRNVGKSESQLDKKRAPWKKRWKKELAMLV